MIGKANISRTAMILAAGFGKRMQPLSDLTPKPLLKIGGQTMLDRAINHLKNVGVDRIVVNGHHLAEQIREHLKTRTDIETIFSFEKDILDTGGGVKKVLGHFGGSPFLLLGGDMPCLDGKGPALAPLVKAWDSDKMDELMLVYPTQKAHGFDRTKGDFVLEEDGRLWRHNAPFPRSHVWLSAQIIKPQMYDKIKQTSFSNNLIFDMTEDAGRFYGVEHLGTCFHVGTPSDLAEANHLLQIGKGWG